MIMNLPLPSKSTRDYYCKISFYFVLVYCLLTRARSVLYEIFSFQFLLCLKLGSGIQAGGPPRDLFFVDFIYLENC